MMVWSVQIDVLLCQCMACGNQATNSAGPGHTATITQQDAAVLTQCVAFPGLLVYVHCQQTRSV